MPGMFDWQIPRVLAPGDPDFDAWMEMGEVEDWIADGCPPVEGLKVRKAEREILEAMPLTVKQAARREGVATRTVYRWLTSGELDAFRVGTGWRIERSALDKRRVESMKPKPQVKPTKRRPARRKAAPASSVDWPA